MGNDRPWYFFVQVRLGPGRGSDYSDSCAAEPVNLWGIFTVDVRTLVFNVLDFEEGKCRGLEYYDE